MTFDEIIGYLKCSSLYDSPVFDQLVNLVEKDNQYRWHDIVLDTPVSYGEYYVAIRLNGNIYYSVASFRKTSYNKEYWTADNIIAWREIEQLEVTNNVNA